MWPIRALLSSLAMDNGDTVTSITTSRTPRWGLPTRGMCLTRYSPTSSSTNAEDNRDSSSSSSGHPISRSTIQMQRRQGTRRPRPSSEIKKGNTKPKTKPNPIYNLFHSHTHTSRPIHDQRITASTDDGRQRRPEQQHHDIR